MPRELATVQDALRHVLVALGDRFEHAVAGAPPGFGSGPRGPRSTYRIADPTALGVDVYPGLCQLQGLPAMNRR